MMIPESSAESPSQRAGEAWRLILKRPAGLLLAMTLLFPVSPALAAKDIEVDWQTGKVTVEEDAPAPEPPPVSDCCPEVNRLSDVVRKQQVLIRRQRERIQELERDLDGQRRVNVRLNQILQGVSR